MDFINRLFRRGKDTPGAEGPETTSRQSAGVDPRRAAANQQAAGPTVSVEQLIAQLQGSDREAGTAAAEALGKTGDPRAAEPLITAALVGDYRVRRAAAEALKKIGDPRAAERIIAALGNGDAEDLETGWWAAAEALGILGDPRAVEPLVAIVRDSARACREIAAKALGHIRDPRAVEPLLAVLDDTSVSDDDSTLQSHVLAALGEIGGPRATQALVAVLRDTAVQAGTADVRRSAACALDELGWQPAMDSTGAAYFAMIGAEAIELEKSDECKERCREIGRAAVEPLITLLQDGDAIEQRWTVDVLDEIGDPRAREPLFQALEDDDRPLRYAAAAVLGKMGDARAIEVLAAALEDDDWGVRSSAAEALGKIDDARVVGLLTPLLHDPEYVVRSRAESLLKQLGAVSVEPPSERRATRQDTAEGGALDLEAVSRELETLLSDYLHSDEAKRRIYAIGEQLNAAGGMSLMRKVGYTIQSRDMLKASWLNNAWDGIGFWQS